MNKGEMERYAQKYPSFCQQFNSKDPALSEGSIFPLIIRKDCIETNSFALEWNDYQYDVQLHRKPSIQSFKRCDGEIEHFSCILLSPTSKIYCYKTIKKGILLS